MIKKIEVKNLYFGFKKSEEKLLKGIDLTVQRGEIIAIVGLSGSGKSTLCALISGVIPRIKQGDAQGEILIDGTSLKELSMPHLVKKVGVIFQNPDTQLFSPTVEDEIAFGPENFGLPREEIGKRISEVINKVGIKKHRFKNPKMLSGGEKQLVALASVLSLKPDILIFDEALSQLDLYEKNKILDLIKTLKAEGKTIIMVEHDFDNLKVADRVMLLKNGKLSDFRGETL
ncbi:ABC transporter ATP-binding protein [Proteinivorax hydrogeniformans]|uniref:ABC transporter ATP-binding protein n=1 Tax=Proteinivorax hydrogeniformans TaxID=1826727 RepID=A0AAU8HRU3_9FIRM